MIPFAPSYGSNQNVTATSTPAAITINKSDAQMRIINDGAAAAYVVAYDSLGTAGTAGTTHLKVPAGDICTVTKSQSHDRLSYYCATTTTLSVMTGNGI